MNEIVYGVVITVGTVMRWFWHLFAAAHLFAFIGFVIGVHVWRRLTHSRS
jgi:hypothetical protein